MTELSQSEDDLVAIARIAKTRGLKGELVADILTDFPDRFEGLEKVTAVLADSTTTELTIENHWFQSGRVVLKFEGVNSIEEADHLRSAEICIAESETVELDEGEYFDWHLVGCRVETIDGKALGEVKELMRTGGTELLVVQGEKEYLIPFAESICVNVDIDNKLVRIDPPEGLLEF